MGKYRYAQPLYGRIVHIFETDLNAREVRTMFSPKTYWIDVTGIDCEVGYIQEFRDGQGVVWVAPPSAERTFEQEKKAILDKIDVWTANKITRGMISPCVGYLVLYDTDRDTQYKLGLALNLVNAGVLQKEYPQGFPVRGYKQLEDGSFESDKTEHYFTAEAVIRWNAEFGEHLKKCTAEGWVKQAEVNACTTKEELNAIDLR